MEIKKSVAVWLISLADKKVLLQKRANFDGGRPQSFTGICQPTWNGKLEEGEDVMDAAKREAEEELGKKFADIFDFSTLRLFDESEYFSNGAQCRGYSYWGVIDAKRLSLIILHGASEQEFLKVGPVDFSGLKIYSKDTKNINKEIVLFEDQYRALEKLFQLTGVIEITS